ncbi:hypothetical protein FT663_02042 [Candidozyma haemuli var. vulneris]|uniref:Uncharacterized protein n=1 Tax=Candidozyma haemuli TaxID=45357 RepID=A0A2V1AMJ6_9ASCO|nr:hypothetical protein CXQ85_001299 [[Candida] haemuloni]KAF3989979.1 hypothetical protein FT662_02543 [[Candida] haemuloni var. vulneris]KAF3993033.1 hypothetical protein FT663_02042 [[Candida] haemuloni var. vulneris]PVH19005.1 hypothetical protein CXQ85_001299 [[Candida] haemuloni]
MLEQFFVFEKYKSGTSKPGATLLPEAVKKNYSNHVNRVYEKDGYIYSGSRVHYEVNENISIKPINKIKSEETTRDIGWEPNFDKESFYAVYAVIHPSQLSIKEYKTEKEDMDIGLCVMKSGNHLFAFPQKYMLKFRGSLVDLCELPTGGSLTLSNKLWEQDSFIHDPLDFMVLPGSSVANMFKFEFEFHLKSSKKKQHPPVTLTEVTVVLEELSTTTEVKNDKVFLSRRLRRETLLQKKMNQPLSFQMHSHGNWKCYPTDSFYQCTLPDIGPTFFTSTQSRTYAMEVAMKVDCSGYSMTLTTNRRFAVASTKLRNNESNSSRGPPQRQRGVVYMEDVGTDRILALDKTCKLIDELKEKGYQYICHRTEGYLCGGKASALSVITVLPTMLIQHSQTEIPDKMLRHWGLDKFGSGPIINDRAKLVLCEYEAGEQGEYKLHFGRDIQVFDFMVLTTYGFYKCPTSSRPTFFSKSNKLSVRFNKDIWTFSRSGNIVVSKTRLVRMLEIQYFSETKDPPLRLHIELHEYIQGNALKYRSFSRKMVLVDEFNPMYEPTFHRDTWSQLRQQTWPFSADKRAYNATLPSLGPSFFAENITRTYMLSIEAVAAKERHKVLLPIEVANKPE